MVRTVCPQLFRSLILALIVRSMQVSYFQHWLHWLIRKFDDFSLVNENAG